MEGFQSTIEHVLGFRVAGVHCGLKKQAGKLDFALVVSDYPCAAAGVFTTNEVKAAPVEVDMQRLKLFADKVRAVAINTGSANACTGRKGVQDAHITGTWVAEALKCREEEVLLMSTGVIGMHLPLDRIKSGITQAAANLGNNWHDTAAAIMTTDTRPKSGSITVTKTNGQQYRLAGISKGAGMIAPNMATMLGVIVTDAALQVYQVQEALRKAADQTYNRIVVDGDMSTNDTVIMLANGASGVTIENETDLVQFQDALTTLCRMLAQAIVRDGEGVTKFITIKVNGAPSDDAARKIGNTVATSPLVKTAFFGGDANWGRIMAAAGRAGVALKQDRLCLHIASSEDETPFQLVSAGMPLAYEEARATEIVKSPEVVITLDCGIGEGESVIWTCDLSHDYVSINGSYRS